MAKVFDLFGGEYKESSDEKADPTKGKTIKVINLIRQKNLSTIIALI